MIHRVQLPSYFDNFGKRVIISPKYYFVDPGLACHLLDIERPEQVTRNPLVGPLFENLVILEAINSRGNQGLKPNLYFYRDSHGNETDLLFKSGRDLHAVEIKSSSTYNRSFKKGLRHFHANTHALASQSIVYAGENREFTAQVQLVSYSQTDSLFAP